MSRSAVLLAAIAKEIADRRAHLDTVPDLIQITISVKLTAGTVTVRGTQYSEERRERIRE